MPLHRATRNCRAVSRQADSALDGIWITDSVLFDSLDRFHNVSSRPIRRMASNTPGPLENRRRTGKRPMTGVHLAGPGSALPTWALPTIPDLTQWSWKAPNDPVQRAHQRELDISTMWPFSSFAPSKAQAAAKASEQEASVALERENVAMTPVVRPFFSELDNLVTSFATLEETALRQRFGHVLEAFGQQLELAALTVKEIEHISRSLSKEINLRFGNDSDSMDYLSASLYETIVSGIRSCRLLLPINYDVSLWEGLLIGMSSISPKTRLCQLFGQVMEIIPANSINKLEAPILCVLETLASYKDGADWDHGLIDQELQRSRGFATWAHTRLERATRALRGGDDAKAQAAFLAHIRVARESYNKAIHAATKAEFLIADGNGTRNLAFALRPLSCSANGPLLKKAAKLFSTRKSNADLRRDAQIRWLAVLAQMPLVGQQYLLQAARSMGTNTKNGREISNVELAKLCIIQWHNRGYFPVSVEQKLQFLHELCAWREEESLAALLLITAWDAREHGIALGMALRDWKDVDLVKSFEHFCHTRKFPKRFMLELAYRLGDITHVLRIKACYARHVGDSRYRRSVWHPRFWGKFAPRMIQGLEAGELSPEQIYEALDLRMYTRKYVAGPNPHNTRGLRSTVAPSVVVLVEKLAKRIAQNEQLGDRQVLRMITQCLAFLGARHARRYNVVRVLGQVLVRDLQKSERGRDSRLQWFSGMVLHTYGRSTAIAFERELLRWRAAIAFNLRARRRLARARGVQVSSGGRGKARV